MSLFNENPKSIFIFNLSKTSPDPHLDETALFPCFATFTPILDNKSADAGTPFGGYRQSGNGREGGTWGIEEYLEVKTISGWK